MLNVKRYLLADENTTVVSEPRGSALDKKVNFLAYGWIAGLVMIVSVSLADVSETSGSKRGNDVD